MSAETPGPLVPAKWAATLTGFGAGLAVLAQAYAAEDWGLTLAALSTVALYAGTGQLHQPKWAEGKKLVDGALVPGLGSLAVGLHGLAEQQGVPLLHLLATTMGVVAGVAHQPAQVLPKARNGVLKVLPVLFLAGLAQGCATTRMLAERPPEEVPHATAPGLAADLEGEERAKECRHVYYWRFFTGIAEDVASTFAGGAAGGAVLTEGDQQRLFAVGGLGFVALSKAFSGAHAELSSRYAEVCREK